MKSLQMLSSIGLKRVPIDTLPYDQFEIIHRPILPNRIMVVMIMAIHGLDNERVRL
jgi:hypothetical protein